MEILQLAIEKLSNEMRIYSENSFNFHELRKIDEEEAISNLDRAFEAKLEAFHSLYDITKSQFNYFAHADTNLLIVLRNAIHHRNHLLFRSWNSEMHLNDGMEKMSGALFWLVNHEIKDALKPSQYYFKLTDLLDRLDENRKSPYLEDKMSKTQRLASLALTIEGLGIDSIITKCAADRFPISQVYINIIPIYISAIKRVFTQLNQLDFNVKGYDSGVYLKHFTDLPNIDLNYVTFKTLRLP